MGMISYIKGVNDIETTYYYNARSKKVDKPVSDTIYVLDIETTSLFNINGKYQVFDYSKSPDFYRDVDKVVVPYIWMFGVEDSVYYGREWKDFLEVLESISDPDMYKVIWCHNLSYEMVFLQSILDGKYTIDNVVARSIKTPIEFRIKELNIIFRCSYMLTNLSLASAAKEYTTLEKRDGEQYNYNVARSPLTYLSSYELEYCEYDIRVVTAIIRHFLKEYEHLYNIPLTSTGIVRKKLRDTMDVWYIRKQQALVPDAHTYMLLWQAFAGGFTHANVLHSGRLIKDRKGNFLEVECEDEASEYPAKMTTERYACEPFRRCDLKQYESKRKRNAYAFLFKVEFRNVKSRYYAHFMQASKCLEYHEWMKKDCKAKVVFDNGRIASCDKCTMILTDVDFEILKKNYKCKVHILEAYKAKKDYLDPRVIKLILTLYKNKTSLKGVEGKESIYKRDKAMLNSLYGMAVTNPLKQSAQFDEYWSTADFSDEFIESKLQDMKKSYSTLMYFACGCWVTAYARRDLANIIMSSHSMDRDVIYCDTDSLFFRNREQHQDIFLTFNNAMIEKYRSVCERYPDDIEMSDFMPADKKGVLHPIGHFEFDKLAKEYITLGAKKYCFRDAESGKLKITVAGVSKKGVSALNDDITKFKKGFVWDYFTSGKSTHFYREKYLYTWKEKDPDTGEIVKKSEVRSNLMDDFTFEDIDGNMYTSHYRYGLVLMPTTYKLGVTDEYESIIKEIHRKERTRL